MPSAAKRSAMRSSDAAGAAGDDRDLSPEFVHDADPTRTVRAMTTAAISPADARRTWRSLEALHGMIYFTPMAAEEYASVGITKNRPGYFASRSAAMGAVDAEVVIATFYNFHPGLVRHA